MKNILEYLENSVNLNSDKLAIIEEDKEITYHDLVEYSKKVGSYLATQTNQNDPVIVFMVKGINALISFMGIVYSGCFYTLINPELPEIRIKQISEVLKTNIVITDDTYYDLAKNYFPNYNILNINELKQTTINEPLLKERRDYQIDYDPLYVNFTSGSTGMPKGVVISHRSVIDFINCFTKIFNFNNNDIIANQAPFDFDVSVKDIYSSLAVGATLLIVPKSYFSNPTKLLDYLTDHHATTLTWAVSALCLVTTFHGLDYKVPSEVNKILFSGEVMPLKHLNEWMSHLPNTTFVNLYGPTEITCNVTYHIIDRNRVYEKIPIGMPFPNERVFLLGENNQLITTPNVKGEICVAGSCLALGYYNNPQQTNEHFVLNPLVSAYPEMIYKTGDLGIYNDENELVFMGRKDFQIKYLGHRIELEEIEKAIMEQENINRCICLFDEDKSVLYSFYIGNIEPKDLVIKLKRVLPIYMIPTKVIKVDNFPMTKNGKIDRQKLMAEVKHK